MTGDYVFDQPPAGSWRSAPRRSGGAGGQSFRAILIGDVTGNRAP